MLDDHADGACWRACIGVWPAHCPRPRQDKVKVGVFPISSSLPYFVAIDLGYFKELNIEPETIQLMGGPPNVAALMTNQIEVVRRAGDARRPQRQRQEAGRRDVHRDAQPERDLQDGAVRGARGLVDKVKSLKDFKGLKLMSAPGPANLNTAKGILAKVGLKDGDYTIDQLDMGQHVNAMKAGTFDGGYTLEPSATIMHNIGAAKTVEAGVIAKYILGDPNADAYAAGCAFTTDFINKRPDVAKRFAAGWAKAIDYIKQEPGRRRASTSPRTR